jgi:hypothetical protein
VPGPAQTRVAPSPNRQVTETALALAVTDRPGTEAVALCDAHDDPEIHTHVGTPTTCSAGTGLA